MSTEPKTPQGPLGSSAMQLDSERLKVASSESSHHTVNNTEDKYENGDFPEGGTKAWMVAAGTASILFSTLGYTNSWGVFQAYYMENQLRDESSDRIAWIGSIQAFLIFAAGAIGGPLFDRYGAKVSLSSI